MNYKRVMIEYKVCTWKSWTPMTAKINRNKKVISKIFATFLKEYHMQRNTA